MQKETVSRKKVLMLGVTAVAILFGLTGIVLLSGTANDTDTRENTADATASTPSRVYGEQEMSPEAAAKIERLKSLARGLKITADKSGADQEPSDSPSEAAMSLQNVGRLPVEKTQNPDTNSDVLNTPTADYKVRDVSARETILEGMGRLGTKENHDRIRNLLKEKQAVPTEESGTETQ